MSGLYVKYPQGGGGGADGVGVTQIATFGVTPNAAGGTVSSDSSTLTLQPANLTNPGGVSTASQAFAGVKTFNSAPIFSSVTASSPLRTGASSEVTVGSISLINEVRGIMPLSSLGSISLETAVIGSLSLANQVKDTLPLSMIGSISLATATVASLSLTAQVVGVLPLANGGTATSSAFTQGSVVFAGPNGVYAQDNANFYWDDTNNRLSIGSGTSPASPLVVTPSTDISAVIVQARGPGNGACFDLDATTNSAGGRSFRMFASGSGNGDVGGGVWAVKDLATGGIAGYPLIVAGATGRVGIGGTLPSATLHVLGSALISAGISVSAGPSSIIGLLGVGVATPTAQLHVVGSSILSAGIAVGTGLSSFVSGVSMPSATLGSVSHTSSTSGAAYTLIWPGAQGGANTVPTNDGAGNIAWTSATGMANPMTTLGDMIIGSTSGAAGRLAIGSTGYTLVSNPASPTVVSWQNETSPTDLKNVGLSVQVANGTLKVGLTAQDGTGLSASNPAVIPFRSVSDNATQTFRRMVTGSAIMTLSAGSNLGILNSTTTRIWIYAYDNSGAVGLCASTVKQDESALCSFSYESFTATYAVTGVWSTTSVGISNNSAISFTTTQQLPDGFSPNTRYYVINVGTTSFELSSIPGGPIVASVGSGDVGVHTWHAQHSGLVTSSNSTAGLPVRLIGSIKITPPIAVTGSFSTTTLLSVGGENQPPDDIAMRYSHVSTPVSNAENLFIFPQKSYDTHNCYAAGKFIAPVTGKYLVSAKYRVNGGFSLNAVARIGITINSGSAMISQNFNQTGAAQGSADVWVTDTLSLNAFDLVTIQGSTDATSPNIGSTSQFSYLSIAKVRP